MHFEGEVHWEAMLPASLDTTFKHSFAPSGLTRLIAPQKLICVNLFNLCHLCEMRSATQDASRTCVCARSRIPPKLICANLFYLCHLCANSQRRNYGAKKNCPTRGQ